MFADPEHARGALRAAIPAAITETRDWSTLAACDGSFVDPGLVPSHSDLLYTIAWREGGEALVYVLFEHQSTCDPQMAYRLLRYQVRIWERWRNEHGTAAMLPVIIPIVLCHGDEAWSAPRRFDDLLAVPAATRTALEPYLVRFTYMLDDLSDIPDRELRARALTALGKLAVMLFKHARTSPDLLGQLAQWADVFRAVFHARNGFEALSRVVRYILLVQDRVDRVALAAFLATAVGPQAKDMTMTQGERLIQQGHERGHREGRQEGRCEMLLRMLRKRFAAQVDAGVEQRLAAADLEQLEAWCDQVLTAPTLDEVFAA